MRAYEDRTYPEYTAITEAASVGSVPAILRDVSTLATGIVNFFSQDKGFGLISREVSGGVSVHFFTVQDTGFKHLPDDQGLEFDLVVQTGGDAPGLPV